MKEINFDIKKFSYINDENADISFMPMLFRRKLNTFGRAALYTLYKAFDGDKNINLVFASDYGDFERVEKLITQRKNEKNVSPAGFSASVHNASIGIFSLLEKIKNGYNSLSAGKKTLAYGFLDGILYNDTEKNCLFSYTEIYGGIKSVSVLISPNPEGKYILTNNDGKISADDFENFKDFLDEKNNEFVSDLYIIKRNLK